MASAPEDFFPLYLTIAEFDIDRGPTIRAQLPSPIPIVSSFLSPTLHFPASRRRSIPASLASDADPAPVSPSSSQASPVDANLVEGTGGAATNDDVDPLFDDASPPPQEALELDALISLRQQQEQQQQQQQQQKKKQREEEAKSAAQQRPENWHQLMSDQMLPDGSDRNERNTSWLMVNRPVEHESGVLCCVFQMSSAAKWQPRAAVLAVIDGVLAVVDLFLLVRGAPSFALPKATIDPVAYLPIGPMSKTVSIKKFGALPSDKLAQVCEIFSQPPLRQTKESATMAFLDTFGGLDDGAAASLGRGASAPKAFAHIRGDACSASIAFQTAADLERVRSWIQHASGGVGGGSNPTMTAVYSSFSPTPAAAAAASSAASAEHINNSSSVNRRCLYGAVVTVTKKMDNARRGSVNFSVCVCSAELRWLHCLQHFLEIVAHACCDATALSSPALITKQITAIADSAYSHVVSKILPVAAGMMSGAQISRETALAAVARRLVLLDDHAWIGLQCITEAWAVPPFPTEDNDNHQDNDNVARANAAPKRGPELATAMLPSHALPPAPLQPVIASTGTSSAASLSSEHCAAAHLSTLISIISEAGFTRLLVHILLQRRVLVISRGGGGSRAAQMAMALGSLFDYFDEHFYAKRVVPYASVSLLDVVVVTDGVVAGTVNPLFETKFGKTGAAGGIDVMVDLDGRVMCVAETVGGPGKKDSSSSTRDQPGAPAEFHGSDMLSRWTEDFARQLRTQLQRKQAAAMSSGGAMLQRNEESSIIEDVLRLTVVREISILLWRMARASFVAGGLPRKCAESRVFLCGKWLGRGLSEPAIFGEHVTRLMLPLDDKSFLDESMIVSFLQHGVRLSTTWRAEECLRVIVASPRAMQCLAVLCCHASSVVRLLACTLLHKLRKAHPVIESCLASQVNMFLHFAVDAASAEFKMHLK